VSQLQLVVLTLIGVVVIGATVVFGILRLYAG
jgi:hypothetical protein